MQFTIHVLQVQRGSQVEWTTLGLGALTQTRRGPHVGKVQQSLLDALRAEIAKLKPHELEALEFHRSTRVESVHLELNLRDERRKRKLSLRCPIVVETRWAAPERPFVIAYHPRDQGAWFPLREGDELAASAATFFTQAWSAHSEEALAGYAVQGRVSVRAVAFNAEPKSILDALPKRRAGPWDDLVRDDTREARARHGGTRVLASIAEDLTMRCVHGELPVPSPRQVPREQLRVLLTGAQRQPCALIGASGSGRSTLIAQAVHDLLAADEYPRHRNADRVRHVWRLSGKRIIAGMSHLGDWEQRCVDLLDDVRRHRAVLVVDDLHHFGRIGRSRDSERNLAEFFRGPVQRGELVLVGECSAEQWQRLEDDVPGFASLFATVRVEPTDAAETLKMLVQARRDIELDHRVEVRFAALRAVMELGAALVPNRVDPGRSVDLVRQLARENAGPAVTVDPAAELITEAPRRVLDDGDVVRLLAARTGLAPELLAPTAPLRAEDVTESLSRSVIGQPEAISAAVDLVARIRAGLTDPRRPYAVYLFTGPTGTGKTALSRAIARYLYGSEDRLLRFDMAEYGGHDAVARLVGDRWSPDGLLTRAVSQQPFCVVLFDEVEKAHPMAHNLLLQLMEDGRLTDASGVTTSFCHAVVVMTSNLGARSQASAGFGDRAQGAADHLRAVREFFSPELFNRIDRVIPFRALTPEVARAVAARELAQLAQRRGLVDRNIFVTATDAVLDRVVSQAFRSEDGARSLKRHIEDEVGTRLTEHIVSGPQAELQLVRVRADAAGLALEVEALCEAAPCADAFPLIGLVDAPLAQLRAMLPAALSELDALIASPAFTALSEEVTAWVDAVRAEGVGADPEGVLFNLDRLRASVLGARARLDALTLATRDGEDWELRALELFQREYSVAAERNVSVFARRAVASETPPLRDEVLRALGLAWSARRQVELARDPSQHAAVVIIERAPGAEAEGRRDPYATLFAQLHHGLSAGFGRAVEAAGASGGEVTALEPDVCPPTLDLVAARVVGTCVLDALSLEHGTHIWRRSVSAPEVVRVHVAPSPAGHGAAEALRAHLRERRARDDGDARQAGGGGALPVVRTIRFEPSPFDDAPTRWALEDFVLGFARETTARRVLDPLWSLWSLRAARVRAG